MHEDLSNIFEGHSLDFWITEINSTVVMSACWYIASTEGLGTNIQPKKQIAA
jgi:hypothetical protein